MPDIRLQILAKVIVHSFFYLFQDIGKLKGDNLLNLPLAMTFY